MIYLLDANFFIQSHRDNYPLDVVVSFWGKFKEISEKGIVLSIDKIYNELNSDPKNPDALS
ncbi:MAG: DUF4411 family protein [Neisseriales bacterium]|nr:MAG: DUF4411 family protein [Neisseriales bacterium]